jgi:hypothetical protein
MVWHHNRETRTHVSFQFGTKHSGLSISDQERRLYFLVPKDRFLSRPARTERIGPFQNKEQATETLVYIYYYFSL